MKLLIQYQEENIASSRGRRKGWVEENEAGVFLVQICQPGMLTFRNRKSTLQYSSTSVS